MNGYIIHEDEYRVVIATGFESKSGNRKTGDMIQTWILARAANPVSAVRSGLDRVVCGSCRHRGDGNGGGRSCYVNVGQAPLAVWNAWKRGVYGRLDGYGIFRGRLVRLGAYGDPTHIPIEMAQCITSVAKGWTGYTHQWRKPSNQGWRGILMASVDTTRELIEARSMGWGTFRVTPDLDHHSFEQLCRSESDGSTCASCLLCNGKDRNIFIRAHGSGARHFLQP